MVVNELLFGFGTGSGAVRVSLDTCRLYHQNSCDSSPPLSRAAAPRPAPLLRDGERAGGPARGRLRSEGLPTLSFFNAATLR